VAPGERFHLCVILVEGKMLKCSNVVLPDQNVIVMLNAIAIRRLPESPAPNAALPRTLSMKVTPESFATEGAGKIALPTMEGICFEKIKHILYLEASGNYTAIHFKDKRQVLVCKTLREVEKMLPDIAFVRIHRSHTIHLKHLKKYTRGKGGQVSLPNGITLAISIGQKELFLEQLKRYYRLA
jgi:two-component system LytT family response regulator